MSVDSKVNSGSISLYREMHKQRISQKLIEPGDSNWYLCLTKQIHEDIRLPKMSAIFYLCSRSLRVQN